MGLLGSFKVGFSLAKGLLESESMKTWVELRELCGGLGTGFEAEVEVFPVGGLGIGVGCGAGLEVFAKGLREIVSFKEPCGRVPIFSRAVPR